MTNIYSSNLSFFKQRIFPKWRPNCTLGLCVTDEYTLTTLTIKEMISIFGRVVVGDAYSFVLVVQRLLRVFFGFVTYAKEGLIIIIENKLSVKEEKKTCGILFVTKIDDP